MHERESGQYVSRFLKDTLLHFQKNFALHDLETQFNLFIVPLFFSVVRPPLLFIWGCPVVSEPINAVADQSRDCPAALRWQ